MSYLTTPQHVSRTTQLLTSRRHRQHRLVAAAIIACIAVLSIAGAVTSWRSPRTPPATRPATFIIITASPPHTATPMPTPTNAPTATPQIVVETVIVERTVFVEVENGLQVTQPEPEAAPTAAEAGPPAMMENETLQQYAERVSSEQHSFGPRP